MQNHLKDQTSPYLLQHADNPVDWYPWCEEAFERARTEDKPIFLSIGYSTCHWCHVMAHESFEDEEIAEILNRHFISIKVDKEERPDIDSIYMAVCQAFTGSGGWPTTVFLTGNQKPFFAGTYFPRTARYGQIGLKDLLNIVHEKWMTDREALLESAEEVITYLKKQSPEETTSEEQTSEGQSATQDEPGERLIEAAVRLYKQTFDARFGGFGDAPKFPAPHNLLFLMNHYEKSKDADVSGMVEKTLLQMYRGGMFDHIGGGFSRYSTDRYFLAPHFEKMLYDNALLILAYCKAYQMTGNTLYCDIARRNGDYILREMTAPEGGFYSAQDADSEGVEGKYYLFTPSEIIDLLGAEAGKGFNQYYDITDKGNFEGKSIPNLLKTQDRKSDFDEYLPQVYAYRKNRYHLHLDDKILTSWNALMIAAMCSLYRVSRDRKYLEAAICAQHFIQENLSEGNTLFVSFREGRRGEKGFLDDYANEIFSLISLYEATLEKRYLERAQKFCDKVLADFQDEERGGFFLYGAENEQLILRPKDTYDGAMPSGNSMMAYNLVRLSCLTNEKRYEDATKRQMAFMSAEARRYPAGYAMFLMALSDYLDSPDKITVVIEGEQDISNLPCQIPLDMVIHILDDPSDEYPLINGKTTFYVCHGRSCVPPTNELKLC